MVTYVTLFNWTQQGMANVANTVQRAGDFAAAAERAGGRVKFQCWTVGEFDGLVVFEAPDDSVAVSLLAHLGKLGNLRTRSMKALTAQEMAQVLEKMK